MRWTAQEDTDPARTADLPSPLWEVVNDEGALVCGGLSEDEAHLIAAAPTLLRAIQNIVGSSVNFYDYKNDPKVELRNDRWVFCELLAAMSDAEGKYDEAASVRASFPELVE